MFDKVKEFEEKIASFYGAPRAVATDCCTHSIELCLRHTAPLSITLPTHTYVSIPMTAKKLGIDWQWDQKQWQDYYFVGNTNIIDAAVYWQQNGYISGTYMCLSFQFKKHLSLGRGGAILCETDEDYIKLKKMSYDGRLPDVPWANQNITSMGYHYYMTPETAQLGIDKLPIAIQTQAKKWTWQEYPDLTQNSVFDNDLVIEHDF